MRKEIYLDNGATTRVRKEVMQVMLPYFTEQYGNPSSKHALGRNAFEALTCAREILARSIGARAEELIFTSGGTEANLLALLGVAAASTKKKILVSSIEHASVRAVCDVLRERRYSVREIPVNREGRVDVQVLEKMIDAQTLLVSVIHGNNEVGTLQDVRAIGALCQRKGVLFHTDAVQSFGKVPIDVRTMQIDVLSASAHKIHGPKGVGFLYVRTGVPLVPVMSGGGQERGLRGGTEHVAGIVGFAKACALMSRADVKRVQHLRDFFIACLEALGAQLTGDREQRLPQHVSVVFQGIDAERLAVFLSERGIFCSTKSACLSRVKEESHVLRALGMSAQEMRGAMRFVLSRETTRKELEQTAKVIEGFVGKR